MATYILLLTLTAEGRAETLEDPGFLVRAAKETQVPGVDWLGLYAVLGRYDFVCIVAAPGNEAIARYSVELGHRTRTQVETLPTVPIAQLDGEINEPEGIEATGASPPN